MTAQKDNQPDGGKGRSGDVQARQSDDGSFELVVENADGSRSSDAPGSSGSVSAAQGEARPPKSSSIGAKRLGAAVLVGLATIGVLVYAFSGDSEVTADGDEMQVEAGFRPYLGGPGESGASQPASSESTDDEEDFDEGVEEQEPAVAADDQALDEAEAWEPEEQGEVVVIEEQHPPEEIDEIDEPAEGDDFDDRGQKPELDTTQIPKLQQRIKFPLKKPELQNLPTPKLNTLKPRLRQNRGDSAGRDQPYGDEQNEFEDDDYGDQAGAPEYGDQDDGFDEYDQGR